jgi:hypothetical protein
MPRDTQTAPVSNKMLWIGRSMSALVVLFLLMDGVMKLVNPAPVVEGMSKPGYRLSLTSSDRDRFAGLGCSVCNPAYVHPGRDRADRLSGRRSRQPTARWLALVQRCLGTGLYRRSDLGRAFLAR